METTLLRTEQVRTRFLWPMFVLHVAFMLLTTGSLIAQETTRYEAENTNLSNASVATTYSGYTGSGYVTGLTSEWSKISFDKGVPSETSSQLVIRYSNGTGAAFTNLALYIGSQRIQGLTFPATASWSTWSTISVNFVIPGGYQNIILDSDFNVPNSINIDYLDLTTGVTAPPGSFSQSVPASGATGVGVTPTFTWGGSSAASTYSLVVSTNSSYTSPVINATGLTATSYTPGSPLANSTTYYWRVTAVNNAGSTISSNAGISFTTVAALPLPGTFNQTAPASAATNVSITPTFTWGSATNASTYSLVVSTNSSHTSPIVNVTGLTGTSYTPTTSLAYSTVYYWRVIATNATGTRTATNAGISFTTTTPPPAPGTFSQTTPANAATGVSRTPAFSWGTSSNASSYTLVVSTNSSFTSPVINQTGLTATSYTPTNSLTASTLYYWRVTAVNGVGTTVASNSGISFTTASLPAPGSFSQTTPAGGSSDVSRTPAFSWTTSSNAATYSLVVSTNSSFSSPVINQTGLTSTSYTPSSQLAASTLYYWRVTAVNTTGSTVASNSGLSFTTSAAPPPPASQPGLIRDIWTSISGTGISALTSNSNYPNSPNSSSIITSFQTSEYGDLYGQRVYGYLAPTVSGSYNFWLAADDDAELWLSTNENPANKVRIAYVAGWTNIFQYDKYGTQASASITLTAGNYYYIEVIHKEHDGGDHISVAWRAPGGSQVIIPSANLLTAPPVPLPLPGTFSQTSPASGATGISVSPTFTWGASSDAASYSLVVSTNSSLTSPIINATGITSTSYTHGTALSGGTLYYWRVTAINATGSRVASNAVTSFTTAVPPVPGTFNQTAPANGATGVSRTPMFTWGGSSNAASYSLVVSTNSSFTNPIINVSGLTGTSYSHSSSLTGSTLYYWRVTAVNTSGNRIATNAGISFTTGATTGTTYYVSTTGVDSPGRGSASLPFRTLSYAATQVQANQNNTIYLNPGTYVETAATILPLGVNIEGAGESQVTITANGPIPAPGVDQSSNDWKLWYDGSLIQLASPSYNNDITLKYGSPAQMTPAANGNQTLSGFTIDGNNKQVKAGVWVQNRNNVTMHHVTIKNMQQRGAVFGRSDMWWYTPLPDGKWMHNTTVHDCTFINSGADISGESLGNLCLAGLDGADIYNITINENQGYGIKFIFVGHYRNVKVHDCNITVPETDASWGEDIAIEMWNFSYGNEIYNINCNTWLSLVNDVNFNDYQPTVANPSNLKVRNVRMIDQDGTSSKEAIECALSGVEISDCYIQDKGFGVAIWGGAGWGGSVQIHDVYIHNNIIANVARTPGFGFGNSSAVFVPDPVNTIKIHNNVFDRMGNGLQLNGTGFDIKNNVFLNTEGDDVQGGSSVTFNNNLKYHTNPTKANFIGNTSGSNNVLGAPGFQNTGSRWDTYYKPASSTSFCVNKGVNVGLAYAGSAPDIGRWEFGLAQGRLAGAPATQQNLEDEVLAYPNPTKGVLKISAGGRKIYAAEVFNGVGTSTGVRELFDGQTEITLDITDLSPNFYLVKIKHSDGLSIKKVVRIP